MKVTPLKTYKDPKYPGWEIIAKNPMLLRQHVPNSWEQKALMAERALIPVADKLGQRLYERKAPMFIQKHYNTMYPVLSLIDDMYTNR